MKIAQINTVCGVKSTGRIATDLARLLEERGHECKIAYGRDTVPDDLQKYAVEIGTPFSKKCHRNVNNYLLNIDKKRLHLF